MREYALTGIELHRGGTRSDPIRFLKVVALVRLTGQLQYLRLCLSMNNQDTHLWYIDKVENDIFPL